MVARYPQRVHSSIWPPSAAVRHRAMASITLTWLQRIHGRFRSMKAAPAARMRSATSSGGRLIYFYCCEVGSYYDPTIYLKPLGNHRSVRLTRSVCRMGGYVQTTKPEKLILAQGTVKKRDELT